MSPDAASEGRIERRTNMFVMASLVADAGSGPVKMRNLSAHGALVEGAVLPRAGSRFRLYRGELSIWGKVVWSDHGRAGLRFDSLAIVSDWLPRAQTNVAQQRIDDMISQMKTGRRSSAPSRAPIPVKEDASITPGDLYRLKEAIESLAEDLAEDPSLVERFASKLQTLDIVAQTLDKLARLR